MEKVTLGKLIRRERRLREIKVKDLASHVGVSVQYIHAIEAGKANPSIDKLNKILGKLEIKLTPGTKVVID